MRGQLLLRRPHVALRPPAGRGPHQELLLRHVLLHLPLGHGNEQQGAHVGQLPHAGRRQVLQAHSRHGIGRPPRPQEVPHPQVLVRPADRDRRRPLHVQGQQGFCQSRR